MKVAALYDIHGNTPALEAVLAELPGAAAIVCGGDCAAGPFPGETLELLRSLGDRVHWIRGNADRELDPSEQGIAPPDVISWVRDRLTEEQIAFLHGKPEQIELGVDGAGTVLFCHATPRNDTEVFIEGTPDESVRPLFEGVTADVVVCGHTHMQFRREIAGITVVNAGSVGMPYEEAPGAYWALLGPGSSTVARSTTQEPWPQPRSRGRRRPTSRAAQRERRSWRRSPSVPDLVRVGRAGRPHGLDGSFVVEDASEDPARFATGARLLVDGEDAQVVSSKRARGRPVIRLDRVVERGAVLEVRRSDLAEPADGSFYVVGPRRARCRGGGRASSRTRP